MSFQLILHLKNNQFMCQLVTCPLFDVFSTVVVTSRSLRSLGNMESIFCRGLVKSITTSPRRSVNSEDCILSSGLGNTVRSETKLYDIK